MILTCAYVHACVLGMAYEQTTHLFVQPLCGVVVSLYVMEHPTKVTQSVHVVRVQMQRSAELARNHQGGTAA